MKTRLKIIIFILLASIIILGLTASLYIYFTIKSVMQIDVSIDNYNIASTTFLDNNGDIVEYEDSSIYTPIESINQHTINAFISIEDKEFYNHNGINIKRIFGAIISNITSLSFKEGASTISQQYIKNRYLTQDKTITRKLKEIYLTLKLEKHTLKDDIMEAYLNTIYFGNGQYGIGAAAKYYFNKDVFSLSIQESATLASIIKSPNYYSPNMDYQKCLSRRNLVLQEMNKEGYITDEECIEAQNTKIELSINNEKTYNVYLDFVINEASNILKTTRDVIINNGYKVYTFLDKEAQSGLDNTMAKYDTIDKNTYDNPSDKLAIIQDSNANIIAASSNSNYSITNLKRQPGSTIKPILCYAPALEYGQIHMCSKILDEKIDYNGYTPKNVGDQYYGYVSIREAISKSLNIPAIKVMNLVGIDKCKDFSKQSGITFDEKDIGYSIALGGFTEGITLNEIMNSFTPFQNNGQYTKYGYIDSIIDKYGNSVYQRESKHNKVMGTDTAYLMNDMLKYSVKNGTSKGLSTLKYDVAGKTGTVPASNGIDNSDVYSIAYTSEHIIGVWFGNYTMNNEYNLESSNNGGTLATKFLKESFDSIYRDATPKEFEIPATIESLYIDKISYESDNIIETADNLPDIYRIKEVFASRYKPSTISHRMDNVILPSVNIENENNTITISFDTLPYQTYEVIEILDNKDSVIKTISNKSGIESITRKTLLGDTKYRYYIKVTNNISNNSSSTDITTIYTNIQYDNFTSLIDNDYNRSAWYFR